MKKEKRIRISRSINSNAGINHSMSQGVQPFAQRNWHKYSRLGNQQAAFCVTLNQKQKRQQFMKRISTLLVMMMTTLLTMGQGWPENYGGVMLQGFYWNSYDDSRWVTLEKQANDFATSFDLIWIPQSGNCGGQSMGYDDLYWFTNYNSSFGDEAQLRSMIKTFKATGLGTIADMVINHRRISNVYWPIWSVMPHGTC